MDIRLNTAEIADRIKDEVDNIFLLNGITEPLRNKLVADKRILSAINAGDVKSCGFLKPEVDAIIKVLAGNSDGMIRTSGATITDDTKYKTSDSALYTDIESFVDVSDNRGNKGYIYSEFPYGDARSVGTVHFVSPAQFDSLAGTSIQSGDRIATLDHYNGRIRFASPMGSDSFIKYRAYVMPQKLPSKEMIPAANQTVYDLYSIRTPHYGEELLVQQALIQILPNGLQYRDVLLRDLRGVRDEAYDAMPVDTTPISTGDNYSVFE